MKKQPTEVLFTLAREADRLLQSPLEIRWEDRDLLVVWNDEFIQRIEEVDREALKRVVSRIILNCVENMDEFSPRFRTLISLLGISFGGAVLEWAESVC